MTTLNKAFKKQIAAGFPSTDAILEHIEAKPEDQRVGIEKEVYDDLQELRRINNVKEIFGGSSHPSNRIMLI